MTFLGAGFFQAARWMSRRNGRSCAQSIAAQIQESALSLSGRDPLESWKEMLGSRRGWRRVKLDLYEFKTGDRLPLKGATPPQDLIAQIAAIEVKPLGKSLPPEAQKVLAEDAVEAAVRWWRRHGTKDS